MKIIYYPDQKVAIKGCPVATIGTFDGLHLGHQKIVKATVAEAKKRKEPSLLITFDQHPRSVLQPEQAPELLTTLEQKIDLLNQFALDYLLILRFEKIAKLTALDFCQLILKQQAKVCHLFVGENFRFGAKAQGTTTTLKQCGQIHNFTVNIVPLTQVNGKTVSSSLIRQLIKDGKVKEAKEFLGRFPLVSGTVVEGDKRGAQLGFPTANLQLPAQICQPKAGIYIGYTIIKDKKHPSVINCGFKPTFGRHPYQCETHIFNFNQNIYGQTVAIQFLKFLRTEQKFSSADELVDQIKKDVKKAKEFFNLAP